MGGPDSAAHPPLDNLLTLPLVHDLAPAELSAAQSAWSHALGGAPVVLLASVEHARGLLLRALGVQPGDPVGLPANATRDLAEAVKHHPATPRWLDLGPDLALLAEPERLRGVRVVWTQPYGGAWSATVPDGVALIVDAGDSLPDLGSTTRAGAVATIFGLHLGADPRRAGALVVCQDAALALAVEALARPEDQPNVALALAQLGRLAGPAGLAARQRAALAAARQGLEEAAGLPLLQAAPGVLAQQIAVRVPEPCDAATFYAYVLGEQTPVRWLPALRPLHYAALRADGAPAAMATAGHLARVLLVPVGPDYTAEEIKHAVLGITKAADYLGVRWATDPARASWYANLMTEWYGPDHDAFRPLGAPVGPDPVIHAR
ncbi:MAG: hypothetical protein HXY37_04755 [Chloroflexi bacterium]|nr:hypothetical protein [Chloroflexota bacterium]